MTKLIAIKIRGSIDADKKIQQTLDTLGLVKKHQARIMENNDSNEGLMRKAKDYIAYGEIEEDKIEELKQNDTISLSPPSKGFKDTKRQYHQGGSLGKRDDINKLLQKMY